MQQRSKLDTPYKICTWSDGYFAIIDVYSRKIMGWDLSNTMNAEWCRDVLVDTIQRHGKPEIFNTDQGSQFTSEVFVKALQKNEVKISMDGKGRALDNIYIERFWGSLKREKIVTAL